MWTPGGDRGRSFLFILLLLFVSVLKVDFMRGPPRLSCWRLTLSAQNVGAQSVSVAERLRTGDAQRTSDPPDQGLLK